MKYFYLSQKKKRKNKDEKIFFVQKSTRLQQTFERKCTWKRKLYGKKKKKRIFGKCWTASLLLAARGDFLNPVMADRSNKLNKLNVHIESNGTNGIVYFSSDSRLHVSMKFDSSRLCDVSINVRHFIRRIKRSLSRDYNVRYSATLYRKV